MNFPKGFAAPACYNVTPYIMPGLEKAVLIRATKPAGLGYAGAKLMLWSAASL